MRIWAQVIRKPLYKAEGLSRPKQLFRRSDEREVLLDLPADFFKDFYAFGLKQALQLSVFPLEEFTVCNQGGSLLPDTICPVKNNRPLYMLKRGNWKMSRIIDNQWNNMLPKYDFIIPLAVVMASVDMYSDAETVKPGPFDRPQYGITLVTRYTLIYDLLDRHFVLGSVCSHRHHCQVVLTIAAIIDQAVDAPIGVCQCSVSQRLSCYWTYGGSDGSQKFRCDVGVELASTLHRI
jgi:hypothetical protein